MTWEAEDKRLIKVSNVCVVHSMADVFHSVTSWRVFIFSLFLIYKTSDSVSSNVLKKCYRHRSYGLQSTCDAKLDDNDNSAESAPRHGNTQHVRHGIRLSRIDPVKVCEYTMYASREYLLSYKHWLPEHVFTVTIKHGSRFRILYHW